MPEKPPSIMCETCGGWHPTEAHAQYEKEAREKRMAEIKARPDSAYRFDTLGFTPEKKGEIEPWMHEVIEKAKELGDDLQDTDFFIHFGPVEATEIPSAFSLVIQNSFAEAPGAIKDKKSGYIITEGKTYLAHYKKGETMMEKSTWSGAAGLTFILELQERWIRTRKAEDLQEYQKEMSRTLTGYIKFVKDLISKEMDDEEFKQLAESRLETAQRLLGSLDTVDGRRGAMDFIAQRVIKGGMGKRNTVGVIFRIGDSLQRETTSKKEEHFNPYSGRVTYTSRVYRYLGQEVLSLQPQGFRGDVDARANNLTVWSNDTKAAQEFYKKFIHALYIPGGSVKVQRDILKHMFEMTKDHPERRLPIYNFYGKLAWPRPPEK